MGLILLTTTWIPGRSTGQGPKKEHPVGPFGSKLGQGPKKACLLGPLFPNDSFSKLLHPEVVPPRDIGVLLLTAVLNSVLFDMSSIGHEPTSPSCPGL